MTRLSRAALLAALLLWIPVAPAADRLGPLVGVLTTSTDAATQRDVLNGMLEALRGRPEVAMETLEHVLADIDRISKQILGLNTKAGQHLRDNEWLMGVRQRSSIPGGVREFDIPSYHYWLHLPADTRRHDLETWAAAFKPMHEG